MMTDIIVISILVVLNILSLIQLKKVKDEMKETKIRFVSEEQTKDIELCKNMLIAEIEKIKINSDKLKQHLTQEVLISIVYLKIFSSYLNEKKFENLEDAWRFMNDIKGIIEKIFYVNSYFIRINESIEKK